MPRAIRRAPKLNAESYRLAARPLFAKYPQALGSRSFPEPPHRTASLITTKQLQPKVRAINGMKLESSFLPIYTVIFRLFAGLNQVSSVSEFYTKSTSRNSETEVS